MREIQTGGSFCYDQDIKKVRRQGSKSPAKGTPMKEALTAKLSNELLQQAISTYCRNIPQFASHEGINGLPEGTIFHELKRLGLLSEDQYRAAELIYTDAINAWGRSGTTFSYNNPEESPPSTGQQVAPRVKVTRTNKYYDRLYRLKKHLHDHQLRFMEILIEEIMLGKDRKIDLATLGRRLSLYKGKDQSRAIATGHWQAFLKSAAEFYALDIRRNRKNIIHVTEKTEFAPVKLET